MHYEDILYQGLEDCDSKEKRDQMVDATIAFFLDMKSKIESGDPAKREEAIQKTTAIQAILTARRNALCERTGLTSEQMDYVSKHSIFGNGNEVVDEAKEKLHKALSPKSSSKRSKRKKGLTQV